MRILHNRKKYHLALVTSAIVLLAGCSSLAAPGQTDTASPEAPSVKPEPSRPAESKPTEPNSSVAEPVKETSAQQEKPPETKPAKQEPAKKPVDSIEMPDLEVIAEPQSMTVLVNKQQKLPENYTPTDLVFPNVPFLLPEKSEKRQMRKEASGALEQLFAAAKEDGVSLAGVSAYRSHAYQKALFNRYVQKDGLEKARTYSAVPGTSEHETGLSIDVSGINGKCAAESCFGGTKEAEWLAVHSAEYGFIIRYPEGKDAITGYMYEPWHIRYVGVEVAKEISEKGTTLEEYFGAVPVTTEKK
ncbi:D-alanyl-D-alanine carboxypeptidase family protein [Brevibacillus sp. NRS-1366]|uniref:M15 family metallopeptidase n=1 Tax=Brevibacillus sp. NRS-1366 TaxID=3233899 RepID=UPI003D2273C7